MKARQRGVLEGNQEAASIGVSDLVVRFGGLTATDHVSLTARPGRVTGLIGPNGAGKTTLLNALCGDVSISGGAVCIGTRDVSQRGPVAMARMGVARTFQTVSLFDQLTVAENVSLGREAQLAGQGLLGHVVATKAARRDVLQRAREAMDLCQIGTLHDTPVGTLTTGQRRLVELARVLCGDYPILLLDEPSSGLDAAETRLVGQILRRTVDGRGTTVVLVEHDMGLVMDVCDDIFVLDFGKLIFAGSPSEIASSPVVRDAYLGKEEGRA